jgi:hypothetical protein
VSDADRPFLHAEQSDFGDLILLVARQRGLPESTVEKDYWVVHTLWGLLQLAFDVWFKGGTCLSKGYGVIHRFSEDLDLKLAQAGLPDVRDWRGSDKESKIQERTRFFNKVEERINIPDMRLARLELMPDSRLLKLKAEYPILHESKGAMRPFVQLEIGTARVEPFESLDLSSWIHDYVDSRGGLDDYADNRPTRMWCVRPEVTLLDKLDAIQGKFGRRVPADIVRHYSDAAQIINWLDDQGVSRAEVRFLAEDMRRQKDVRPDAFNPEHPALNPAVDDYWASLGEEHLRLADWYWAEYPSLDEACVRIREFILEADLHALASE